MSSKDFVSPRKQKKRPYRTRHGSHVKINLNLDSQHNNHYHHPPSHHHQPIYAISQSSSSCLNNNNSNLNNIKPLKPIKAHSNLNHGHSRTLSYIKSNNNNSSNPRRNGHKHRNYPPPNHSHHTQHKIDSPLTPIKIQPTFTSPLPSPEPEMSPIVSPIGSTNPSPVIPKKKRQNRNFLSFSAATQNFSVSLPSSPVTSNKSNGKSHILSFKDNPKQNKNKRDGASKKRVNNHEMANKMQKFSSLSNIDDTPKPSNRRKAGRPRAGTGPRSRSGSIRKYRDKSPSSSRRQTENIKDIEDEMKLNNHPFMMNGNNDTDQQENIRVMVRFRPFNKTELRYDEKYLHSSPSPFKSPSTRSLTVFSHDIHFLNDNTKIKMNYFCGSKKAKEIGKNYRAYSFKFDQIFENNTTQKEIFNNVAKPICDDILQFKSNNATIFCYGQSGSGKTHTMFGVTQV